MTRRRHVLAGLLVAAAVLAANSAAALPPYPLHPEGAILTSPGTPHAQYIIMVSRLTDRARELHQLSTLLAARDVLRARFHLATRPGHTPRSGYDLTCIGRTRVDSITIWLAAWAAPDNRSESMKQFRAMVNPKRWQGACRR
jgi:hypothetical protein